MEQRLLIRETEIELIRPGSSSPADRISLEGTWDLIRPFSDASEPGILPHALKRAADLLDGRKPLEIVVPDILFVCRVLSFDRIPVSISRRQELINWKMQAFLPDSSDRFQIRYDVMGNRVLVAALPVPVWQQLCNLVEAAWPNAYRMIPESVFLTERFVQEYPEGLLIAFRNQYITAIGIQSGFPVLVRSRLRVSGLSVSEEVELVRNLLSEQADGYSPEPLLLGSAESVSGLSLPEGWDQ